MRARRARLERAAANLALRNIARVTWREKTGVDKTAFVNYQNLKPVSLLLWGQINELMTGMPHSWVVSTVIKCSYHNGHFYKSEEYVIKQQYKLASLYEQLEELGQDFVNQQRADTTLGIGAIVTQTKGASFTTEQAAALVEIAQTKGYTDKEVREYAVSTQAK